METGLEKYRDNPVGFARDVLGIHWTPSVIKVAESILTPPYRVLIPAAHSQGKTHACAGLAIWWFCTRHPAIVISTAPTLRQVQDLLWKEIRVQVRNARRPLPVPFTGPRSLRAERSPEDFMLGVTASTDTAFQGHHGPNKLFILDEAVGVAPEFWTAIEGMADGEGDAVIAPFNPTDNASQAYREYQRAAGSWHVQGMSAVDHPNIAAELRGEPPVIKSAMRLGMFERLLRKWSSLLTETSEKRATDLQWPPTWAVDYIEKTGQKPRWYRPGPLAESRLFARFPSQSAYAVWSDGDWQAACRVGLEPLPVPHATIPEIGCDVARYGDDNTACHVRCGSCSLHHEEFNGQDLMATVGGCVRLCKRFADLANTKRPSPITPKDIPIKVDDSGVGGGVTDRLTELGYCVAGVNARTGAIDYEEYPSQRDELWFRVAEMARDGTLDLSRLDAETLDKLKGEAMAQKYKLNSNGQRVVWSKDTAKSEIGASPDGMDALNLAYCYVEGLGRSGDVPRVGSKKAR